MQKFRSAPCSNPGDSTRTKSLCRAARLVLRSGIAVATGIAAFSAVTGLYSAPASAGNPPVTLLISEEVDLQGRPLPTSPATAQLFRRLSEATGLQFRIQPYPWKRALEQAYEGEGLLFGASPTPERERKLLFSDPVYTERVSIITLCDKTFPFRQMRDLKGKTLGVVNGTSYGAEFDRLSHSLFRVENDTSRLPGRLMKLTQGRMDGLVIYTYSQDQQTIAKQINQQFLRAFPAEPAQPPRFCVLPNPVSSVSIHFAIRYESDHGLIQNINQGLKKMQQQGVLQQIYP
ncbi:substrate-binding periplasmic protein [Undibacterium squillarum]|uniref:substrate-binding periplasmic protein n=1 Tax=Undibacterium squillarum TaxID=1131567 RepID=UPI0035B303BF